MRRASWVWCGVVMAVLVVGVASAEVMVKSKSKPDKPWKEYPTRTLEDLKGFVPAAPAAVKLDTYGGVIAASKEKATGFFYPKKIDGRWWLITPEGNRFIHVGVASVNPLKSPGAAPSFKEKFGTQAAWASATARLLHQNGFNGSGAWADVTELPKAENRIVYTMILNLMSGFGKSKNITYQKPGHAGYPNDCFPAFHPEFEAYCDQQTQKLAKTSSDPWLIGYFSDNELPPPNLEKYLKLDPADPNMGSSQKAAAAWLAARHGGKAPAKPTEEDKDEFVGYVFGKYFEITTKAIRKHDPNHLCIGSRYHSLEKRKASAWREAGKHLDLVSVNYYGVWTPEAEQMKSWAQWSGKPFMVTEWYTKGEDSGFANTTGAGWIVPTQKDRGLFYQNYVLALMESKVCVGWHWFKYQDNDPADTKADPSNRDSNKGIVNVKFEPYGALLEKMRAVNEQVYAIVGYFDGRK